MAARSSWKGYLRLSLVSVPVKAYTATTTGGGEIHLNQIHADCHSRIRYQKVCPIHGEVSNDAIVSGYEFAKGQFVVIDPDELDKLRTESDKAVQIATFVAPLVVLYSLVAQPMTLVFSPIELAILAVLVVMFAYIGQDGESNWLEGAQLLALYAMAAILFFALPPAAFAG